MLTFIFIILLFLISRFLDLEQKISFFKAVNKQDKEQACFHGYGGKAVDLQTVDLHCVAQALYDKF